MNAMPDIQAVIHHVDDAVAVAVTTGIGPGHRVGIWTMENDESTTMTVRESIPLGHKIAIRDISAGTDVLKFGSPIGKASIDIRAGEHVHIHNLRSNRW
jgi:(2R)-sulfolactate sulfo-lyase subunit alpha